MSDKNVFSYFKRVYTDKAEYREQMAGLKKLPREYQVVYKEIQNFLRNKLHIMLSTDLQKRFMQLNLNTTELEYSSIYLTHALFGVCQTWIAHGKKESPQEITDFLMKMLGDTN